jgi:hypothetical protein
MLRQLLLVVRSGRWFDGKLQVFQEKTPILQDSKVGITRIRDLAFARRGWLPALLIVLGAVAISSILTGRQVWLAGWGIIDDHEVFDFLGTKQHLPFSEIISTILGKTEVGSLQGRFRPSYYFLRVMECWAWGRNVHLWYGFVTAAFAFFLGSVWWVISRFLGLLPAALCMAPIALANFWGGIWGRLGPAEIYAAPATGLMLLGCYELFFSPTVLRRNLGCAVLTIGTLIAIGTKETLLPLAVLTLFLVALATVDRRLPTLSGLIACAVTLLVSSSIVFVVLKQLAGAGVDVYGNSVSPAARIKAALISMDPFSTGFIGIAMLAIATVWWYRKPLSTVGAVGVLGTLCFLLGLFISQQIAYGGSLPTGTRYDFPAMLIPIGFACFIGCAVNLRDGATRGKNLTDGRALLFAIAVGIVFLSIGGIAGAIKSVRDVEANIAKTKEFSTELAAIVSRARTDPAAPVILEAYGAGAYEAVFSLQRYLLSEGLENPIGVRLHPDQRSQGPLYDGLEQVLRTLQDSGGRLFVKLENLPAAGACLSIGINGEADMRCSGFRVRT